MIKLLVDMNLSHKWTPFLREAGMEAVHWTEVGPADALDQHIMAYAREHGYVILTRDLDFGEILALASHSGPSVVQLRGGDPMPHISGMRVWSALERFGAQISEGALVTISLSGARVRILPIAESG